MGTLTLCTAAACALATAAGAGAQTTASSQGPPAPSRVVGDVEIVRQNVFDSVETSRWYARLANAIHVTTREHVVARELLVVPGEPLDSVRLAESARNLRALSIFRKVEVDTLPAAGSARDVRVTTRDAWSTKLFVKIGISGSQTVWSVGAGEANLLGTGIKFGAAYKEDPDRSTFRTTLSAPRIVGNRIGASFAWNQYSDGQRGTASVSAPFLSLESRESADLFLETIDAQVLRFVGGDPDPAERDRRRLSLVRANAARALRASPTGYLRLSLGAQLRREDFAPESSASAMPHTVTAAILATAEVRRAGFLETSLYQSLGAQEDVDVSTTLTLGLSLAPDGWGYERRGVGPSLGFATGRRIPRGFALLRVKANGLYTYAGLDSGAVSGSGTIVVQPGPRQVVTLYLGGAGRESPYPGQEYDLGLDRGPRAFAAHAFTGDRSYFAMGEYRIVLVPAFKDLVSLGAGAFVERGGAWFAGSPRRGGTDAGVGLRLAPTRAASAKGATRVDIARRFATDVDPAGWVFVFGAAYPFRDLW